ncbi:uncharacterized protein LOC129728756 [Wyeomyia smithii]|uniref:uncharacterized protein LOC129728756 n=1 Tax=Wyeomyia smithii TaxID=174621 RepID=UPI002467B5AD|nr:uncharacterized protein LOC129728756 [Wyeomyia smithii]
MVMELGTGFTDDPTTIAGELAQHYEERSATSSYSLSFRKIKEKAEKNHIETSNDTEDLYNSDFSLTELLWALDKGRSMSTGPDNIGYPMIQRLPSSVKSALLELLNRVWRNKLERSLPNNDEHCLMASLDLSKAYDTTWRYGILRTLEKWRIRGRMLNMMRSFLSQRSFQVTVEGQLSRVHNLENGVPQGSVLSVTLFLVAMQPVFRVIPSGVTVLLYADDILLVVKAHKDQPLYRKLQAAVKAVDKWAKSVGFTISAAKSSTFYGSPNVRREPVSDITIERVPIPKTNVLKILGVMKLQAAVKAVDKWAKSVGFTISAAKSSTFYGSPNVRREPVSDITIERVPIPKTNVLKILGVMLDRSFRFSTHCRLTKKMCDLRLRILKILGAKLNRGHRISLLKIGSAIVTSRLLYGVGLITRGNQTAIQTLAPVYNRMIRLASRAFVTSPIHSILAEAGTLPFNLLVLQSTVRTAIRILEKDSRNTDLPLVERAREQLLDTTGETILTICLRERLNTRAWNTPPPSVVWDIKRRIRAGGSSSTVRPLVQELLSNCFQRYTALYTDGSKCSETVGAGLFGNDLMLSASLPPQYSVFSAEAYAITMALTQHTGTNRIVVLSDSASCLSALEAGKSTHPWIQKIERLAQNKPIEFCWIPGHAGVYDNIEADRLAGEARNSEPLPLSIPADDATREIERTIRQHWNSQWFSMLSFLAGSSGNANID